MIIRNFKKNPILFVGIFLLSLLFFIAIFAPWISPFSPYAISLEKELCLPNNIHLLGCDANGIDILSSIFYGTRISLFIGVTTTLISLFIAFFLGSIAGYYGGKIDIVLMRILDIIFAFPGILLAIAIASLLKPSVQNLIFCLSITGWAGYTRLIRGEVRNIMTREYIESSHALGIGTWRIIIVHIWPNILSTVLVTASFGIAGCILAEASLSFLGIGVPPGTPSWGALLSFGKDVIVEAPHVATFPGIAILLTVLSFNFLGEGLRQWFDPKE